MKKGNNKALVWVIVILLLAVIATIIIVAVRKNKKYTCSDGSKVKKGDKCPDGKTPTVTADDNKAGGAKDGGTSTDGGTGGGGMGAGASGTGGGVFSGLANLLSPSNTQPQTGVCANMGSLDTRIVLKRGDKKPEVCYIQSLLKVDSDGVFGSKTESAMYAKLKKKQATMLQVRDCVIDGRC